MEAREEKREEPNGNLIGPQAFWGPPGALGAFAFSCYFQINSRFPLIVMFFMFLFFFGICSSFCCFLFNFFHYGSIFYKRSSCSQGSGVELNYYGVGCFGFRSFG
jgi:hypothetical protein